MTHAEINGPHEHGSKSVILLYHRVAEVATDPFELAVSPKFFREHLEVLHGLGRTRSLSELARGVEAGALAEVSFAVTFDDGYADNLHAAKPILERLDVPATVFVATACIGGAPFWWDELAELVLGSERIPERIELELDGVPRSWELGESTRDRVFKELWELLQSLEDGPRRQALAAVRSQLAEGSLEAGRSLAHEELVQLAGDGLVDVGAHSKTHPVLARLAEREARDEILGSKAWLEDLLSRPVPAFSYPYGGPGHYGEAAVRIVRDGGFDVACSAVPGVATASSDVLQLPRVTVGKWDGQRLERELTELLGTGTSSASPTAIRRRSSTREAPKPGGVEFGDLRRLQPVSGDWGFDRGKPIDRYYIERFLHTRSSAIRGRVLEIGEPFYTQLGGDRVVQGEILDVNGKQGATYTCRLEVGDELPSNAFDCVICTQTLQYIHDVHAALQTLRRILKPSGRLLLSVPGITGIGCGEPPETWHWAFTRESVRTLLAEVFGEEEFAIEASGNVLVAVAFLHGLSASELTQQEIDHTDPNYQIVVAAEAVK